MLSWILIIELVLLAILGIMGFIGIFIGKPCGMVVASLGMIGLACMISLIVVLNRLASAGSVSPLWAV